MAISNLIIVAKLSEPPSEGLYFRHLTMVAKNDLLYSVLLESKKELINEYFKFLKLKGWFDFIDDFTTPDAREEGVRVDTDLNYPLTVKTDSIKCENVNYIIEQIKTIKKFTS